jgi:hypothetical protein
MSNKELPPLIQSLDCIERCIELAGRAGDLEIAQSLEIRLLLMTRRLHEVLRDLTAAPVAPTPPAAPEVRSAPSPDAGTLAEAAGPAPTLH